ncbi:MAG: hypothetical protein BLM47_00965 [Candidatus Reconcilbacillus cellulovorans]|uniref:Zinc finger DksA/TraR C4-type domain-containing protein n=1 Tax=Candidatus Reconcilbacillus cellulovorans TaxID=1906605 RepID=A0A2A6E403_9BACL|nr:MAG: hypothetical protein BLM47_00965 [Candidatus Reconcilbacillus cellulovorans]
MRHLTEDQLARLRTALESERSELSDRMFEPVGELSAYDNHPGDLGSETFERGKDVALTERARYKREAIDRALEGMNNGTYGRCDVCGRPIPFERLLAVPYADRCADHAEAAFVSARRPAEEDRMRSRDDFAWQTVEHWGNASGPATGPDGEDGGTSSDDDADGFVEPIESFVATDFYGRNVRIVRNRQYREYLEAGEGERLLEPDPTPEEADRPS